MATSEQLEREAESTRAEIAATLDELRSRMTAGQVVDQLVDYAGDNGGGEFVRDFGRRIIDNPIPVTLVGAGLAWLMMAGRRAGDGGAGGSLGTSEASGHDRASVGERAAAAGDPAGSVVREAASSAYEATAERSRQAADAIARGAGVVREGAATSGQQVIGFLQSQPLVVAGIGLALGALLGASFAATDAEDRLMGEASDAMKRDARSLAEAQVETGKAAAAQAWNAAKSEADAQLHRDVQHSPAGSVSGASTTHPDAGEATLVPAEETGPVETAGDGVCGVRPFDRRPTSPSAKVQIAET
jgi:hypothetical protein